LQPCGSENNLSVPTKDNNLLSPLGQNTQYTNAKLEMVPTITHRPWWRFQPLGWLHFLGWATLLSLSNVAVSAQRFDCNPCIKRADYTIKVVSHGTSSNSFWTKVQAAALQAGRDMGVTLDFDLYEDAQVDPKRMADDILAAITSNYDALVVTIYDEQVQDAIRAALAAGIPVFAFNAGYEVSAELGVLGYVGQEEYVAGQVAAQQLLQHSPNISQVLIINHEAGNPALQARINGATDTFLQHHQSSSSSSPIITVTELWVDMSDVFSTVTSTSDAIRNCPYDGMILLGGSPVELVLRAVDQHDCHDKVVIGTFDESSEIFTAIANGDIRFTISQQQYLQSVLPVVLASLYATTGKKLALPQQSSSSSTTTMDDSNKTTTSSSGSITNATSKVTVVEAYPVFQSGPRVIDLDNLPSDTQQTCASESFPICPNTLGPNGKPSTCKCLDRSTIRIGGVVHGVTSDTFWDVAFGAAEQTALDLGIELDFPRFQPEPSNSIVWTKMAQKIRSLCQSGVIDGIFVSIPSDEVISAIQECQALNIPVVSTNTGADVSAALGLVQHVGMLGYQGGWDAAQRMIEAGMQTAYCLDHDPGNMATAERCQGFEDGIAMYNNNNNNRDNDEGEENAISITYGGTVNVPLDAQTVFRNTVEDAVGLTGDWTGVGILVLGSHLAKAAVEVKLAHPNVLVGSFDTSEDLIQAIADGNILFGIDQQVYLQGSIPVYLLAYGAYSAQQLATRVLETGPSFITSIPTDAETICEANLFEACQIRPQEDFHFISSSLVLLGYVLLSIMVAMSIISIAWIWKYQSKSPLVKVSQPTFLRLIIMGSLMSTFSVLTMGRQTEYRSSSEGGAESSSSSLATEGRGVDEADQNPDIQGVDAACMTTWWLFGIGFAIMFAALFAKIRRVKTVYNASVSFRKRTVPLSEVAYILVLMVGCELIILLTWQLFSPERWQRHVTEESDGFVTDSVGECTSDHGWIFAMVLSFFHVICLFYALVLCFQTKHIPSEFAESNWVSLAVMSLFQILVIGIPIYVMVGSDTNIFYFVRTCMVFLQNFTVLSLIMGPKMYRVYTGDDELPGNYSSAMRRLDGRQSMGQISHLNLQEQCFHCGGQFTFRIGDHVPLRRTSCIPLPGDTAATELERIAEDPIEKSPTLPHRSSIQKKYPGRNSPLRKSLRFSPQDAINASSSLQFPPEDVNTSSSFKVMPEDNVNTAGDEGRSFEGGTEEADAMEGDESSPQESNDGPTKEKTTTKTPTHDHDDALAE
jgi:simple sugar transport system substrate-binding protein